MTHFVLTLPQAGQKKILQLLKKHKIRVDCSCENVAENALEIYAFAQTQEQLQQFILQLPPDVRCKREGDSIDWEKQWQQHAPYYKEGIVYLPVDCGEIQKNILLAPGPGFGDYSHPTTRLSMDLLQKHALNKKVLDIGTGSGVLALAAMAIGAKHVLGFDIDSAAVMHAKQNVALNHMEAQITVCHAEEIPSLDVYDLCVMNMLPHEQMQAYHTLPEKCRSQTKEWITSGVLIETVEEYLSSCASRGWQCIESKQEDIWSAFYFQYFP